MLKKTITFTDYNGNEIKDDYYFNLTKRELVTWQSSVDGGILAKMQKAVDTKNVPEIMALFEELISKSYGIKSDDGKRFIKSKEISEEFMQTPAYDELFMSLMQDENAATAFIKAVVPAELTENVQNKIALEKEIK